MMAEIEVDEVIGDEDAGSSQGIKMEEIEHTVCPTLLQMAMMNDTNRVKKTDIFDLITKPKRRGRPRKHSDFMTICSNKLDDTSQFEIQQLIEAKTMTEPENLMMKRHLQHRAMQGIKDNIVVITPQMAGVKQAVNPFAPEDRKVKHEVNQPVYYWQYVNHGGELSKSEFLNLNGEEVEGPEEIMVSAKNVILTRDDGSWKSNRQLYTEEKLKNFSIPVTRCPMGKQGTNKILKLYMSRINSEKQIKDRSTTIKSKIYGQSGNLGIDESPGAGFLRCCNCKEWYSDKAALARHTRQLIQCNICVRSQPPGYNNYEKPYFCTKTELQLHFRGKHTKQYLEMVSAVTGKPAGKKVQLGRHNHLKADLNICASSMNNSTLGADAKALITEPLPTNHYNHHNKPGDLSTCKYRKTTFRGSNFKVHIAPDGGWKTPSSKKRLPYSSDHRNGRFTVNDIAAQAAKAVKSDPSTWLTNEITGYGDEECTIEEVDEFQTPDIKIECMEEADDDQSLLHILRKSENSNVKTEVVDDGEPMVKTEPDLQYRPKIILNTSTRMKTPLVHTNLKNCKPMMFAGRIINGVPIGGKIIKVKIKNPSK